MPLLEVSDLSVEYRSERTSLRAVENLSFHLQKGKSIGLVGESGCGKSTAMLALTRLLPENGRIVSGKILLDDTDLLQLTPMEMRHYRWKRISLIFQCAMNGFNPTRTIESQIAEAIRVQGGGNQSNIQGEVALILELVGIDPGRAKQYPHQFSGGMRQRAMIAMALACHPDIVIADEPTTALDVMIQAQILNLLQNLQKELNLSIILVTHDLGIVAEICDDVLVMYAGQLVEYGSVDTIFNHPQHPYTQKLLEAFPDIDNPGATLAAIPGYPPALDDMPDGCRYHPRCHKTMDICSITPPVAHEITPGHLVHCHLSAFKDR